MVFTYTATLPYNHQKLTEAKEFKNHRLPGNLLLLRLIKFCLKILISI